MAHGETIRRTEFKIGKSPEMMAENPFQTRRTPTPETAGISDHNLANREMGDPRGGERENKGETQGKRAINQNAPDLGSRFRGSDKKREGGYTAQNVSKFPHRFFQRS